MSGIIVSIIQNKLQLIFHIIINILIIRFIFLELGFRIVSKFALNELTKVIGIKRINHHTTATTTDLGD